jgi:hypothetical protein
VAAAAENRRNDRRDETGESKAITTSLELGPPQRKHKQDAEFWTANLIQVKECPLFASCYLYLLASFTPRIRISYIFRN